MFPTTQEQPQAKKKKKRRKSKNKGELRADRERDEFTPYQNEVYKRTVFGLSMYSQKEINTMDGGIRKKLKKLQKQAQKVINSFKQEEINKIANSYFRDYFPDSSFTRFILETPVTETEPTLDTKADFRDLGITKKQICDRLIMNAVLPSNFYEVRVDPTTVNKMPRLKTTVDASL